MLSQTIQTPSQQKWLYKLLGFDYEISYKPGRSNLVADALSRTLAVTEVAFQAISVCQPLLLEQLKDFYVNHQVGRVLMDKKLGCKHWYYKKLTHQSQERILTRLAASFAWPQMAKDVKLMVRECSTCQANKHFNQKPMGLLQPLPIPSQVWEDIARDFITHLPPSNGKAIIWVVIHRLSKFAHFIALPPQYSAVTLAPVFLTKIYRLH